MSVKSVIIETKYRNVKNIYNRKPILASISPSILILSHINKNHIRTDVRYEFVFHRGYYMVLKMVDYRKQYNLKIEMSKEKMKSLYTNIIYYSWRGLKYFI